MFSTKDVRVIGEQVLAKFGGQGADLGIGKSFKMMRVAKQFVLDFKDGEISLREAKPHIMRVAEYVLKRTNTPWLIDAWIDSMILEGLDVILDWVADENEAEPLSLASIDPEKLLELASEIKDKLEDGDGEEEFEETDPSSDFDDPRESPDVTQESQMPPAQPKVDEGGEDDPRGAPPA